MGNVREPLVPECKKRNSDDIKLPPARLRRINRWLLCLPFQLDHLHLSKYVQAGFSTAPLFQCQHENRPTSQLEALLDEGFHGRAALVGSLAFLILVLTEQGGREGGGGQLKITLYILMSILDAVLTLFCITLSIETFFS